MQQDVWISTEYNNFSLTAEAIVLYRVKQIEDLKMAES
jgi:hypothetical protein